MKKETILTFQEKYYASLNSTKTVVLRGKLISTLDYISKRYFCLQLKLIELTNFSIIPP